MILQLDNDSFRKNSCEYMQNPTGNVHVSETCYIESFTEVREFLHSIRKVGATNSNEESYCQSPSLFRTMLRIYERDFTEKEGIMATYHALFTYITKEGKR